jgi:hypothetical protein
VLRHMGVERARRDLTHERRQGPRG